MSSITVSNFKCIMLIPFINICYERNILTKDTSLGCYETIENSIVSSDFRDYEQDILLDQLIFHIHSDFT